MAGFLLVVVLLVAGGCSRSSDPPSQPVADRPSSSTGVEPTGCSPARSRPTENNGTLAFGGVDRRYTLHLPPAYDGTTPLPLVLDFHGYGSSAGAQLAYSGITPIADREGFVVAAPEGQGTTPHFTLLGATATEADDVEFTVAILDHLAGTLCLDATRTYALGMSNGGALSSVLACRAGDRFAAVGAVAAIVYLPQPCEDAVRLAPVTAMMGTADPIVPYAGGRVNCCGNPNIPPTEDTLEQFATRAGCDVDTPATDRPVPTVEHRTWQGCDAGAAVELFVIEGGGHTWPGSPFDLSGRGLGASTPELPATERLWSFFERHRLSPT